MALMMVHSASVSSKCGLGIIECNSRTFSTSVEIVKRNIYSCRDRPGGVARNLKGNSKLETRSKFEIRSRKRRKRVCGTDAFEVLAFEFVSGFDFRISSFRGARFCANQFPRFRNGRWGLSR